MALVLIAFGSFVIALSGALVPGPLFSITVSESARRGFIAGPLIILGHGILELAMVALLLLGVAPLLTADTTKRAIGAIGGIILIYMGYALLRDARGARLETKTEGKAKGMNPVVSGIVGSVSNPYWTIWWVTIGLGYLIASLKYGMAGVVFFFVGHVLADLAWYSLVSFAISRGRKVIGDRGYRALLYGCGVLLFVFGGWFALGAI